MSDPASSDTDRPGDATAETLQRRALTRMKAVATGLLLLMAAVFVATHVWHVDAAWLGYVQAFAEAAMVGALADWFAVTALFRHPLGLPIPHTAIIPRRKDQIGDSLARFVREHFVTREALGPRMAGLDLATRAGRWLKRPGNARRVTGDAAGVVAWVLSAVDDSALKRFVRDNLHMSLSNVQVTPLVGRVLDLMLTSDRHQRLMDEAVRIASEQLSENKFRIRLKIRTESPWWLPKFVDEEIYDRIVGEMESMLKRVGTDENHEARIRFTNAAREFVESLKTDPAVIERGEQLKEEVLKHPAVQAWLGEIWTRLSRRLLDEARDADSAASQRAEQAVVALGDALLDDEAIRQRINAWLQEAIIHLAVRYGEEIASVISETVRSWDAEATSERVELQVGRDLQFIRINGTVVGGLAGLVIHAAVQWL